MLRISRRSSRSLPRVWVWWSVLASGVLILAAVPANAATPEVVRDRPHVTEVQPSASGDYLVWAQGRATYVKHDGSAPVRLNPVGTLSFTATIDGTTVVYQQIDGGRSRLRMYDAVSGKRSALPEGVNTSAFELEPSLSGDWLLFTRFTRNRVQVVLFNLATGEDRTLANLTSEDHFLVSDQVNGDWATWESCDVTKGVFSSCDAYRYRISTSHNVKIPNTGRQQYAAGVGSDGTAYLVSTGGPHVWSCGNHTKLVRQPVSGAREVIATLPEGIDSLNTFAFEESDGSIDLLFEWFHCADGTSGIYQLEDADSA